MYTELIAISVGGWTGYLTRIVLETQFFSHYVLALFAGSTVAFAVTAIIIDVSLYLASPVPEAEAWKYLSTAAFIAAEMFSLIIRTLFGGEDGRGKRAG